MDFVDTLGTEHRRIARVLSALERTATGLAEGAPSEPHEFFRIVTFLRGFADGYHHEREEQVLLGALSTFEYGKTSGVLEFIRQQHREERTLLSRVEVALAARAPWSPDDVREIVESVRKFVTFEREHMARENELLYPSAKRAFEEHGTEELDRRLDVYGRTRASAWSVSWLERLGDEIASTAGV